MSPSITCEHCGAVIGVYEPLVVVIDGVARETSQAARPDLAERAEARYHLSCYPEHAPGDEDRLPG